MGNALSSCSGVCDGGKTNCDALDTVCMSCKERFGPNRRAYLCHSCKGGFCESCGIVRAEGGPPTCSSCISMECNVPPSAVPHAVFQTEMDNVPAVRRLTRLYTL